MARHSRTAGPMLACVALAHCACLSIRGSGTIFLIPRTPGGSAVDILRADQALKIWFVVMIILFGVVAPSLHRYDVRCVLIWITFGWFVLGALLPGYRGNYL
jgi:hypothetical protein